MEARATKTGITLKLTVAEAVALEAVLGQLRSPLASLAPSYDDIADALEDETFDHLGGKTISDAVRTLLDSTGGN